METKEEKYKRRFFKKVSVLENKCWNWTGALAGGRQPCFVYKGKNVSASRVALILYKGEEPEEKYVFHTCKSRLCVNPDHLKPAPTCPSPFKGMHRPECDSSHIPKRRKIPTKQEFVERPERQTRPKKVVERPKMEMIDQPVVISFD